MNALAPGAATVRKSLSIHAAIGLLAGALLYILSLSGTLVVIHEEWQRWEQPGVPDMASIAPEAVQRAAEAVLASEAGKPLIHHLFVHLPNEALPRTVVTTDNQAVYVDASGAIAAPEAHRWTEFMLDMHYYLHLPSVIGLTLVGGLGVMMLALGISGIIAHPRIFRDAFRLRARGAERVARTDWHNRLGVWTLPFSLAVALTGALLGLASVMAFLMAATYHDGDTEAVFTSIFGEEPAADARPAPLADIGAALSHMAREYPGVTPTYAILHEPGTRGQHLQILADHPRRLIFGEYYAFEPNGQFRGTAGLADGALGQQISASVYKLHFGSFGGLPVKLAYILFGIALCVISATGMSIWLAKRRQKGRASPRLEGFWTAIVWGTPAMMAVTLGLRMTAGANLPLAAIFWAGLSVLALAGAMWAQAKRYVPLLKATVAALLIVMPTLHFAAAPGQAAALVILNIALALTGAIIAATTVSALRPARVPAPVLVPGE